MSYGGRQAEDRLLGHKVLCEIYIIEIGRAHV